MATTKKKFAKAIVIGGSIAGMMAARAASDFCEHVTIVDRDELLSNPSIRQGAPHAVQPHTLLEGGRIIMEEFFPGLTQDLIDAGNIRLNATAGLKWFHHGVWKCDEAIDLELLFQSRIHLEKTMRSHILKSDNISFLKASIKSLDYDQENNRVTGVITGQASLKADIVVDASGRNSKLSTWLKAMNCHVPKTTEIPINIKYQSRLFYRDKADRTPIVIYPKAPEGQHCAYLFPVVDEHHGHCWLACITCREDEQLPKELSGFMDFIKNLDQPDIFQKLQQTKVISEVLHKFHFKSNKWPHYEKCRHLPDGIFAIGDSFGLINPLYGQGMSLAAQQSRILSECLAATDKLAGLNKTYHKRAAKVFKTAWFMVLVEDWRYPKTSQRPPGVKFLQWYTARIHELSSSQRDVINELYHVLHLIKPSYHLIKPSILAKVLFAKKK